MEVPMQFSRNQLLPSIANGSETKLKKKASLEQNKSHHIIPLSAKKKKTNNNTEIENTSVNFNMLNYPEESISESDW